MDGMTMHPLAAALFAESAAIRYVAIGKAGVAPLLFERSGIAGASSGESDFYEESIVNPTLLTLLQTRGAIGCGGVEFVLIRYGNFMQCVLPQPDGHLSVSIETAADPMVLLPRIRALADAHR